MMNFNFKQIQKNVERSVTCVYFQLFLLLAVLFCYASIGQAQELLYDAAGQGELFDKIGGTQKYTLSLNDNISSNGAITMTAGAKAVKVGNIERSNNDGVTVIVLLSNINVTGGGQLTELPIADANNSNACGFKIKGGTSDGTIFPTGDGTQWGGADGIIKVPTDNSITAVTQVYKYGIGNKFYIDGVLSFSNAGLQWSNKSIHHLRIGGNSLSSSNFLNEGMKIHRIQIYAGELTAEQIAEKSIEIKNPPLFGDVTTSVKSDVSSGSVAFDDELSTTITKPWGASLTARATPPSEMQLIKWINTSTGAVVSTSNPYTFSPTSDLSLLAIFGYPQLEEVKTPVANDEKWYFIKSQRNDGSGPFWTLQLTDKVIPQEFKGTDDQKFTLISAGNTSNVTFKSFNEKTISLANSRIYFNSATPLAGGYTMTSNVVNGVQGYLFPGEASGLHQGAGGWNWEVGSYYNVGDNCTFFFFDSFSCAINIAQNKLVNSVIGGGRGEVTEKSWIAYASAIKVARDYVNSSGDERRNAINLLAIATRIFEDSCNNKIYVSMSGNDANDGFSWEKSKATIQAGINAAKATEEVWVEDGDYLTGNAAGEQGIALKSGVSLYGGFLNGATNRDIRNARARVKRSGTGNCSFRIMTAVGSTNYANVVVSGFEFDGENRSSGINGGGVGMWSPGLTIDNCIIKNFVTTNLGGGIYINSGNTVIQNCDITGNQSSNGGGIWNNVAGTTVDNCRIAMNKATGDNGGGIRTNNVLITIKNSWICSNRCSDNGGAVAGDNFTLSNSVVANNWSSNRGASLWNPNNTNKPIVKNCTIVNNDCLYSGGDISGGLGQEIIINTIFWDSRTGVGTNANWLKNDGTTINSASSFKTAANMTGATAYVELSNDNAAATGPQFVKPSTMSLGSEVATIDPNWMNCIWQVKATSPLLNKGTLERVPARDVMGNNRINPPTIGAFEKTADIDIALLPTDNCYYFTMNGAGTMNGSSWENAAHGTRFSTVNFTEEKIIKLAKGDYYLDARKIDMKVKIEGGYDSATGERPQIEGGQPWEYVNVSTIYGPSAGDAQFFAIPNGYNLENQFSGITLSSRLARSVGGGIIETGTGTINATNCVFENGKANENGGAIFVYDVGALKVNGCYFLNNQSAASAGGAAIDMFGGVAIFENCYFYLNYGTHPSNAIGSVALRGTSSADFIGCSFIKNRGGDHGGGAIWHNGSGGTLRLINTLVSNNGSDGSWGGSAIRAENAGVILKVINSTVVYTKCGGGNGRGHGLLFSTNPANELINSVVWGNAETNGNAQIGGTFTATNSAVQGLSKDGVINLDASNIAATGPNFKNVSGSAGYSGYSAEANWNFNHKLSPLFEAGTATNAPTNDIQGKSRPSHPNGLYDIGAYEFQYPEIGEITRTSPAEVEGVDMFEFDVKLSLASEGMTPVEVGLEYENGQLLVNPPSSVIIPKGRHSAHVSISMIPNTTSADLIVKAKPVTLSKISYVNPAITPASVIAKKATVESITYTISLDKSTYTEGDNVIITISRENIPNALIAKTISIELTDGSTFLTPQPIELSFNVKDQSITKSFLIKDLMGTQWGGTTGKEITFSSPTTDPLIKDFVTANPTISDKDDEVRRVKLTFTQDKKAIQKGGVVTYTATMSASNFPDIVTIPITMTAQANDFTISQSSISFASGETSKTFTVTSNNNATYNELSYGIDIGTEKPDWMDFPSVNTTHFIIDKTIAYITPTGSGNKSGADWANAAEGARMQELLSSGGMKEVRLSDGEYNITTGIALADDVSLIGGWNITTNERDLTQRPIIKTTGINGARQAAFKPTATTEATRNVFDGLIMQWVNGDAPVIYTNGAVYVTMKNVDFNGYASTSAAPINLEGIGFNVVAEDCKFFNTDGNWMGTVHIYNSDLTNFLKFERCVIDGNTTKPEGLICLRANITMNNCIVKNSKGTGNIFAGILTDLNLDGSMPFINKFTNCTFIDNINRPLFGGGDPTINLMKNSLILGSPVDLTKVKITHSAWEDVNAVGTNIDITGKTKADLIDENLVPLPNSILVNAGSNIDIERDAKDFVGNLRIWNPSGKTDGVVDIGVCESQEAGTINFTIPDSAVYTGSKLDVVATYADDRGPHNKLSITYSQNGTVVDPINVGIYDVSASDPSGHWNIGNQTTLEITKAAQHIVGIPPAYSLRTDKEHQFTPTTTSSATILMNAPSNNYVGVDSYTVKYTTDGSYTITFSASETSTHFAAKDVTCDLTVSENSVVVTENPTIELNVDSGDNVPEFTDGEVKLNGEGDPLEGVWSWNNSDPITIGTELRSAIFTPTNTAYLSVLVPYVFNIKTYTLTANAAVISPVKDKYVKGDLLTITATPNDAQVFDYWVVEGITISSSEEITNPLTFTMPADNVTVTAHLSNALINYVTVDGSGRKDGSSWRNAADLTQIVSLLAKTSVKEVRLAVGNYPLTAALTIPPAKTLSGGWDSTDGVQKHETLKSILSQGTVGTKAVALSAFSVLDGCSVTGVNGATAIESTGSNAIIRNCRIYGNTRNAAQVSTVIIQGASSIIEGCLIYDNISQDGVVSFKATTNGIIRRCKIVNNNTNFGDGGAVRFWGTNGFVMEDCLIANNSVTGGSSGGGSALFSQCPNVTVRNCTVVNNQSDKTAFAIHSNAGTFKMQNVIVCNSGTVTNTAPGTLINSAWNGITGSGNINISNLPSDYFVSPNAQNGYVQGKGEEILANDYTLLSSSQLINAGSNSNITSIKDLSGNARIWNPEGSTIGLVDMGAYENQGALERHVTFSNYEPISHDGEIHKPVTVVDSEPLPRLPAPNWVIKYYVGNVEVTDPRDVNNYTVKAIDTNGHWFFSDTVIFIITDKNRYNVTIDGGTPTSYFEGTPVTGTVAAPDGSFIEKLTYTNVDNLTETYGGKYSFTMPGKDVSITSTKSPVSTTRYVTVNGSNDKLGHTWNTAMSYEAFKSFDFASSTATKVCMAAGEYKLLQKYVIPTNKTLSGGWDSTDGVQKHKTLKSILRQGAVGTQAVILSESSVLDGFSVTGVNGATAIESSGSNAIIRNSRIYGNTRNNAGVSTVIIQGASNIIEDCLIYDNISQDGVVSFKATTNGIIRRCKIVNNNASFGDGGAVRFWGSNDFIMEDCLIANNNVNGDLSGGGSALFSQCPNVTVRNCTVVNNQSNRTAFAIFNNAGSFKMQNVIVCNSGTVTNTAPGTLINSAWNGITGSGNVNISNSPSDYFVSSNTQDGYVQGKGEEILANDYTLLPLSQLINAGKNSDQMGVSKDLAGEKRVWNPAGQGGGVVDMGAYEFQGAGEKEATVSQGVVIYNGKTQKQLTAQTTDLRQPITKDFDFVFTPSDVINAGNYDVDIKDALGHWIYQPTGVYTISKADQNLIVTPTKSVVKLAESLRFTTVGGESGNPISVVCTPATYSEVGGDYTFTATGDYTFTFTQLGNGNYNDTIVSMLIKVVADDAVIATLDAGNIKTETYSKKVIVANSGTTNSTSPITYQYRKQGESTWGTSAILAGTYDVKLSVEDDGTNLENTIIASGNLVIKPKELTVSGLRITKKPYDGTVSAFVSYWGDIVGVISSDDVKYIYKNGTAVYDTADIADAKKVTVSGLIIEGVDAENYTFTGSVDALGDITNKAISQLRVVPISITNAAEAIEHAGQVKLEWDAVTDVTDFMIEYGMDSAFENTLLIQGTTATISELLKEAIYSFRLSYNEPNNGSVLSNTIEDSAPYYAKVNESYFPAMAWEPNNLAITSFATPYSQGTGVIDANEFVEGRDHKNNNKVWMRDFTNRSQPFVVFGGMNNTLIFSVAGENSKLHVWIDLDNSGTFDENEHIQGIPENGIVSFNITPSTSYGSYMMMRSRVTSKDETVDAFGFENLNAGMAWDAKLFIESSGEDLFTVTLTSGDNGNFVDASGATITSVSVLKGNNVDIQIKPNEKYSIESVSINGKQVSIKPAFTLRNVQGPQTVSATFTNFPTVYIDVNDGTFITSKEEYKKATVVMEQNSLTPDGDVIVKKVDNIEIKGRGNSTWSMEKKPYRLKFSKSNQQSYLGLGVARNWVLLANYIDPTGLKNDVAFEMGRRLNVPFTKNTRPVRLILNGRYDGLYQLTSHNEVRDNKNAVDINENDWYSEFDTYPDEFIYKTPKYNLPMKFKQPEYAIGGTLDPVIKAQIDKFENDLFSNKTGNGIGRPDLGYENSINEESFIDWLLVHMIAGNYEPKHPKSSYYHTNTKTGNGKITAGNLWDFDWAYGYGTNEGDFNTLKNCMWYSDLFKYPKFMEKFKKRWNEIRPMLETDGKTIYTYIDENGAFIENEQNEDYARWNKTNTYSTEKEGLKTWMRNNIIKIQTEVDKMDLSTYTKTITAGTVSSNLTVTFPPTGVWGDSIRITISPSIGYSIGDVKFNTTIITPINGVYEFMMPNQDVTIDASSLARQSATITVVGGTASPTSAYEGDVITVTTTSSEGSNFNNWSASPSVTFSAPFESTSTFVAPAGTINVTANFITEDHIRYVAQSSVGSGKGLNWANAAPVDLMTSFLIDDNIKTLHLEAGNYSIQSTISIPSTKKCIGGWQNVSTTPDSKSYSILTPLATLNQVATLALGTQTDSTLFENMIISGIATGNNGVSTLGYSVIRNCQFINNNYENHLLLVEGAEGVHIDSCIISNNIGSDSYGALFIKGSILITKTTIEGNTKGSGIYAFYSTNGTPLNHHFILRNSKINTNTSSSEGGGIYIEFTPNNGDKLTMTQYLIEDCQFAGNRAPQGGAFYMLTNNDNDLEFAESPILISCDFLENVAILNGGAIFISAQIDTSYQVRNCIFFKNTATLGGAFYTSSNVDIWYTTLVNNTANAIDVDNTVSTPTVNLINTILYKNAGLGITKYINCAVEGTTENAGKTIEDAIYENSFYIHPSNNHALGPRFKHKTSSVEPPESIEDCDTEFFLAPRSILINRGKQINP